MNKPLLIIQMVVAFLLIFAVTLQNRGSGTGAVFGGGNQVFRAKRGAEKTLYYITIILGVIFFALSFYIAVFLSE